MLTHAKHPDFMYHRVLLRFGREADIANGPWGYFGVTIAKETSFCWQALKVWRNSGCIEMTHMWISENFKPP